MPAEPEAEVEVGVVRWVPAAGLTPDDDPGAMGPASTPRHARPRPGLWQRTITAGHETLAAASEGIAAEVDIVADRMIRTLEARQADRAATRADTGSPDPAWALEEVEVGFGLQLTGEASIAVFSASSESSAQVTLRFSRAPAPTNP